VNFPERSCGARNLVQKVTSSTIIWIIRLDWRSKQTKTLVGKGFIWLASFN